MKKLLIIQPSLRKNSLTAEILHEFQNLLSKNEAYEIETIDLREKQLEFCDGREIGAYNSDMQEIFHKMQEADTLIFGFPIYHYAMSGVLKNLLDVCGDSVKEKRIGVIVSALLPDCQIAYEHFFESFEKKYHITRISEVPYILNDEFQNGKLSLLSLGKLQKLVHVI